MKKYSTSLLVLVFYVLTTNAQVFDWAKGFGSSVQDEGRSIATDASGNVYSVGTFRYDCDFDPGTNPADTFILTSAGGSDVFLQKLDANGDFLWAVQLGGAGWELGNCVTVDDFGNLYVVGSFSGTADFNPSAIDSFNLTAVGIDDIFIVKLTSAGAFVWAKQIGGTTTDEATSVAVDGSGNVFVTGRFQGTVDFNPGAGTDNLGNGGATDDIFVCRLDASGNYVWAKAIIGSNNDVALSVVLDNSGNVYLTGFFYGTVDFNPGSGTDNLAATGGGSDIFIAKLDGLGNYVWARNFGNTGWDVGYDLVVDGSGNVYATGRFEGTTDFDPGVGTQDFTSAGQQDIYILKLNSSGNYVWAKTVGSTDVEWGQGIALDGVGNLYVTGIYQGTVDFNPSAGTTNLTSIGGDDVFITKFDVAGNHVWSQSMGGANALFGDRGQSVTVDASGNVYTAGWFYDTGDFDFTSVGTLNLTSQGSYDIFVHKISQPGNGIQENNPGAEVAMYPNPTSGEMSIDLHQLLPSISLKVTNAIGQIIFEHNYSSVSKINFNLEGNSGLYFATLSTPNGKNTYVKVVKQ